MQGAGWYVAAELRDAVGSSHFSAQQEGAGRLAKTVAGLLLWPDAKQDEFANAAAMHDVGKLVVPGAIVCKPGPLSEDGFHLMKQHSSHGYAILAAEYYTLAAEIALRHHEAYDGSGYPSGLRGEAIPMPVRIVTLCDCYDALRESRPYGALR